MTRSLMALAPTPLAERRSFPRHALAARVVVHPMRASRSVTAEGVNFSEGGLCLRLREALEVRSPVQLQVTLGRAPAKDLGGGDRANNAKGQGGQGAGPSLASRPVTCTGRVAWVIQRLDLRETPPFLFDTGIECANPPPILRHLIGRGVDVTASPRRTAHHRMLEPSLIRGRDFMPRLERTATRPPRWHLVVSVDGVPCFSAHYPSERVAGAAWARFKRQQAKR